MKIIEFIVATNDVDKIGQFDAYKAAKKCYMAAVAANAAYCLNCYNEPNGEENQRQYTLEEATIIAKKYHFILKRTRYVDEQGQPIRGKNDLEKVVFGGGYVDFASLEENLK